MEISWKSRDVADVFDKARYIPEGLVTGIFAEIFGRAGLGNRCRILDAGCGTGRISVPLAKKFPELEIVGVDVSDQMLGVLEGKIRERALKNYTIKKASLLELSEPERYDIAIVSSVLHAIRDWRIAVDNILEVTGGYLVLITETSDMYRLVLNRQQDGGGLLERFWGEYSRLRKEHSLAGVESTQVGIKWQLGCPEVLEYLGAKGFGKSFELSRSWSMEFTVGDLMEIVEKKAYSSMFVADEEAYGRVVSGMRAWLKKEGIPYFSPVRTSNDIKVEVVKLAAD